MIKKVIQRLVLVVEPDEKESKVIKSVLSFSKANSLEHSLKSFRAFLLKYEQEAVKSEEDDHTIDDVYDAFKNLPDNTDITIVFK